MGPVPGTDFFVVEVFFSSFSFSPALVFFSCSVTADLLEPVLPLKDD
jgi:hypothetical protein